MLIISQSTSPDKAKKVSIQIFALGIWYGFGFCPCTEWHYQVRYKLGHYDMPWSYIKFILDSLTGLDFDAKLVNTFTLIFFLLALAASIYSNTRKP